MSQRAAYLKAESELALTLVLHKLESLVEELITAVGDEILAYLDESEAPRDVEYLKELFEL